ncbi:HD domain-containing protein [Desulfosporosinus youngiae]|uniref:HD domain-containing protein n=1 Tax=Desulfosporosinus youngiae DSM 17734 TaxID=768710 RepID=H5XWB8_9FIRM|nr:HD domain-containing protein [Desulfosporosinus youngiae]EHQ90287.1 HD domain-containing protein [Desulfosporosinus youngiae DSM 17734]
MLYRINQFILAVFPRINPSEKNWALGYLSPEAKELFLQQSLPEQRHAINVAKSILETNPPISLEDLQNLITAALLHDCGKSLVSIRLWQRVYIVLMQKTPQSLRSRLEKGRSVFAFSLRIDVQHALWGESLAKKAGLNSAVCLLIREHHTPSTYLGRILEQADNMH